MDIFWLVFDALFLLGDLTEENRQKHPIQYTCSVIILLIGLLLGAIFLVAYLFRWLAS